ncbi:DUF3822 family protein [uncultured Winogradskyella sp.]|uniref:DUF3822 family protein n=1 Tax=uncultured Winogradskyella sp. TaxID=395353 RepID=UPI002605FC36|nr:DUF3822 family protein [uncultured Winogradskyella sp.]
MTNKIIKDLSIQVNLSGLSFCILNRSENNKIEYSNAITFGEKLTPFQTLNRLKEELASNTIFSDDFNNIKIIHHNELSTLVPESLYDEPNNAEYLKFNSKILKTDFIASDKIESLDSVNVYVPYVNINNYIFDTFGVFTYTHASSVFIDAINLINDNEEKCVYINIEGNTMQVVVNSSNAFDFYNYFEFTSPEDFIYYILFTFEQLQLNPEKTHVKLSGTVDEDDDLFKIAYKYIRHVSLVDGHKLFLIKNSF